MPALSGEFEVNLNGVTLPVVLNLHALNLYLEEEGLDLSDLDTQLSRKPLRSMPRIVWAGVQTAAALKGTDIGMTFEQFSVRFGSIDWQEVTDHVNTALNLQPGKAKPAPKTKASR